VFGLVGQYFDDDPFDGGNSTKQSGNRDFFSAGDWSSAAGEDPKIYELPAGLVCVHVGSNDGKEGPWAKKKSPGGLH
jgi:hypothetical protein